MVLWIDKGLTDIFLVGPSSNRRQLAHESPNCKIDRILITMAEVIVEGGERTNDAGENRHRVSILWKCLINVAQILVKHRVHRDVTSKLFQLFNCWQIAINQEVAHLQKIGMFR